MARSGARPEPAWSFREAHEDESEALATLHLASWQATYRAELPPAFLAGLDLGVRTEGWKRWFRETPMRVLVAETRGRLLGLCAYGPVRDRDLVGARVCEIYNLHVAPGENGQGIGSALLARAVIEARARGQHELSLWVVVTNTRARRFYERAGLRPDGRAKTHPLAPGIGLEEIRYRAPLEEMARRNESATGSEA